MLLPPDFHQRFDAGQRELILRHELSHLQRGDALWSLLAELTLVLLWFHPLAWLALPRFRLDQELACDEHVLRATPEAESRYAQTLLHSTGMEALPALIPWLAEPQLKERLIMIQHRRPTPLRRHIGFVALASLMLGCAALAQAGHSTTTAQSHAPASQDLSYNIRIQPQYPSDAIKNGEHGMVMLMVRVGKDGKPRMVEVDRKTTTAPVSLIKAASDTAMQWRFNPALKHGKPIEGYVRVPVRFDLTPQPDESAAPVSSSKS
jgi:TonB family protein